MSKKSPTSKLSSVEPIPKSKDGIKAADLKPGGRFFISHTFCERIVTVFSLFCRVRPVIESFRTQVREHLVRDDLIFFQRAKNFVCWFRAYYLKQELPNVEGYKMKGPFRRWAFPRLKGAEGGRSHNRRNDHLWNSFFLLKNCCLPVTDAKVMQELHGHFKSGPLSDTTTPTDIETVLSSISSLLDELAVKMRVAFDKLADPESWMDSYPASNKAAIGAPQSSGGEAMGLFYSCFPKKGDLGIPIEEWGIAGPLSPLSKARKMHDSKDRWDPRGPIERKLLRQFGIEWAPSGVDPEDGQLVWSPFDMSKPCEKTFFWFTDDDGLTHYMSTPEGTLLERHWSMAHNHSDFCYHDSYWHHMHYLINSEEPVIEMEFLKSGLDEFFTRSEIFPESRKIFRDFLKVNLEKLPLYPEDRVSFNRRRGFRDDWVHGYSIEEFLEWEGPWSKIVAVKEPLKVRVIGVSDALTNFLSTWYQKTLHGLLSEYPAFELLAKSPCANIASELYEKRVPGDNPWAMSSDFKGASNNTPKALRDGILERIQRFLPDSIKKVNRWCNGDHMLEYNFSKWVQYKKAGKRSALDVPDHPPQPFQICSRGTQMGRKTSFPILSLEVFATYATAVKELIPDIRFDQIMSSVRVNGDDLLSFVSRELHDKFWSWCVRLQFDKSVGKSYFHARYANINSQSYMLSFGETVVAQKSTGLYCGLLMGQKKLATDVFDPTAVITALLDSCYDEKMEHAVLKTFLGIHKKMITAQAAGRNLFIPVALGGCGQRKPRNWHSTVSPVQKKVASFVLETQPLRLVPSHDVLREVPKEPLKHREVWDVQGVPTFWDEIRKLQAGDGEQVVPMLGPDFWALTKSGDFTRWDGPLVSSAKLQNFRVKKDFSREYLDRDPGDWKCPVDGTSCTVFDDECPTCLMSANDLGKSRLDRLGISFPKVAPPEFEGLHSDLLNEYVAFQKLDFGDTYFDGITDAPPTYRFKVDSEALVEIADVRTVIDAFVFQ